VIFYSMAGYKALTIRNLAPAVQTVLRVCEKVPVFYAIFLTRGNSSWWRHWPPFFISGDDNFCRLPGLHGMPDSEHPGADSGCFVVVDINKYLVAGVAPKTDVQGSGVNDRNISSLSRVEHWSPTEQIQVSID
jgi:hypothetical protein